MARMTYSEGTQVYYLGKRYEVYSRTASGALDLRSWANGNVRVMPRQLDHRVGARGYQA